MAEDMTTLQIAKAQAEIEKIRAETARINQQPSYFEKHWRGVLTVCVAILTALGGMAGLISSVSQAFDLWSHVGQQKELLQYKADEYASAKSEVDEEKKETAAERLEWQETQQIDSEKRTVAALREVVADLEKSLHDERVTNVPKLLANQLRATQLQIGKANAQVAELQKSLTQQPTAARTTKDLASVRDLVSTINQTANQSMRVPLVYMQYADSSSLDTMKGMEAKLAAGGYIVPGIEKVNASFLNPNQPDEVRYFQVADKKTAQLIAKIANSYSSPNCPNHPPIKAWLHYVQGGSSATAFEIWTGFSCASPPAKS